MNEILKCPRGRYGPSGERENDLPLPGIETQPNQYSDYTIMASRNPCTKIAVNWNCSLQYTLYIKQKDLDTDNLEKPLKHNLTNLLTANKNTVRYCKQYEVSRRK